MRYSSTVPRLEARELMARRASTVNARTRRIRVVRVECADVRRERIAEQDMAPLAASPITPRCRIARCSGPKRAAVYDVKEAVRLTGA